MVSDEQAQEAVRILLAWIKEDPSREGLKETPQRFLDAFKEHCEGYGKNPEDELSKTFTDVAGYEEPVILRDIPFASLCEHHLAPFTGVVHVAYLPNRRVVGLSKLARVVEVFAKRLQIQERLTAEIAETLDRVLQPQGVLVIVEAEHHCMSSRGVKKQGSKMITMKFTGVLRDHDPLRKEIINLMKSQ